MESCCRATRSFSARRCHGHRPPLKGQTVPGVLSSSAVLLSSCHVPAYLGTRAAGKSGVAEALVAGVLNASGFPLPGFEGGLGFQKSAICWIILSDRVGGRALARSPPPPRPRPSGGVWGQCGMGLVAGVSTSSWQALTGDFLTLARLAFKELVEIGVPRQTAV